MVYGVLGTRRTRMSKDEQYTGFESDHEES